MADCIYICNICDHQSPEPQLMTLHLRNHSFLNESDALQAVSAYIVQEESLEVEASTTLALSSTPTDDNDINSVGETEKKLWPRYATLALIKLVEEYDRQFQKSVKKHVWTKIAALLNTKIAIGVTWQQCDSKWKSLKKTYKYIKDHNSNSGKNRRKWEFFDALNNILFNKPEISAPATCSSQAGLVIQEPSAQFPQNENISSPTPSSLGSEFESSFSKKRKIAANSVERRHKEKMQRQDIDFWIALSILSKLIKIKINSFQ